MRSFQRSTIILLALMLFTTTLFCQTRSGKLGIGVAGSADYFLGDGNSEAKLGGDGGASLFYSPIQYLGIRANVGMGKLRWQPIGKSNIVSTDYMYSAGYLSLDMAPSSSFNPFIFGGAAAVFYDPHTKDGKYRSGNTFDVHYSGGAGLDYFINEFWSLTIKGEYVYTNSKYYNGDDTNGNDSFLRAGLEVRYYFFDQNFVKRMLEALKDRYKNK